MREQEIFSKLGVTHKRISTIYKQLVFLDCRMNALETVMRRPLARLIFIFSPSRVLKQVDELHILLMQRHDDEIAAKQNRQRAATNLIIPKLAVPSGR